MTLHEDNSLVLTTIETGQKLLWFDFDPKHIGPEDSIADI